MSESNNKKQKDSSLKNFDKSKYIILLLLAMTALTATTYSLTKSYYRKDLSLTQQHNNPVITIDYYDDWKEMNKSFYDDMRRFRNDMIRFQHSLFDQLDSQITTPRYLTLEKMFNENKTFYGSSITKNEKEYLITIEIPGFSKEQIQMKLSGNSLIIKADNKNKDNLKQSQHSFTLQNDIDADNIKSKLENGILTVTIPRIKQKTELISIE